MSFNKQKFQKFSSYDNVPKILRERFLRLKELNQMMREVPSLPSGTERDLLEQEIRKFKESTQETYKSPEEILLIDLCQHIEKEYGITIRYSHTMTGTTVCSDYQFYIDASVYKSKLTPKSNPKTEIREIDEPDVNQNHPFRKFVVWTVVVLFIVALIYSFSRGSTIPDGSLVTPPTLK